MTKGSNFRSFLIPSGFGERPFDESESGARTGSSPSSSMSCDHQNAFLLASIDLTLNLINDKTHAKPIHRSTLKTHFICLLVALEYAPN